MWLVKKFTAVYGTQRSITLFTKACHRSLSWVRCIQSSYCFPKIHCYIILPPMPRSSKWSLPFRSSDKNFVHISHLFHACYMPCPSHPPSDCTSNVWWSIHVMKLPILQASSASCHFLGPDILLSTLFSNTFSQYSSLTIYLTCEWKWRNNIYYQSIDHQVISSTNSLLICVVHWTRHQTGAYVLYSY